MARTPWKKLEDYELGKPKVIELWDENWDVFHLYLSYPNQWRVSAGGPVGLDMSVFHHALDRKGIKGDEFDEFVEDLLVIESAALKVFAED